MSAPPALTQLLRGRADDAGADACDVSVVLAGTGESGGLDVEELAGSDSLLISGGDEVELHGRIDGAGEVRGAVARGAVAGDDAAVQHPLPATVDLAVHAGVGGELADEQ